MRLHVIIKEGNSQSKKRKNSSRALDSHCSLTRPLDLLFDSLVVEIKMEAKKGNESSPQKYLPFLMAAEELGGWFMWEGGRVV